MEDNVPTQDEVLTFQELGEQSSDIMLLFSPFLPFNNLYFNDFFYNSTVKYKKVFSNISPRAKADASTFNCESLLNAYKTYIASQKINSIILVGYGIFTNLFIRITKLLGNKINCVILMEPDFGNSILTRMFDSDKKPLNKKSFFTESFCKDLNIPKRNKILYSNYYKYIKAMETSMREYLPQHISLKEILEIKSKTLIMWHIMEKDLWPLAQVLQEDYNITTFNSSENFVNSIMNKDRKLLSIVNAYIDQNLVNNN